MLDNIDAEKNLIFGLLALQNGFVQREQLLLAFNTWIADRSVGLDQILVQISAISPADSGSIQQLVARHLRGDTDAIPNDTKATLPGQSSNATFANVAPRPATLPAENDFARTIQDKNSPVRISGKFEPPASENPQTRSISDFQILKPHAEGGLGAVYLAQDLSFGRQVAIKQIKIKYADDQDYRWNFLLEAEVTAQLEHPGIIPVYAMGEDHSGRPFYAMRFVRGRDFESHIGELHRDAEAGKTELFGATFRKLLRRLLAACDAISYAHDRGVIHRDLKPSNIMLGRHGETLVVDWGLAKPLGVKLNEPARQPTSEVQRIESELPVETPDSGSGSETRYGTFKGTAAYAPPEQVLGNLELLGITSDVYSLGAILFEILSGKRPVVGKDRYDLMRKVARGELQKLTELQPKAPRALVGVCLKALSLNQEDRYQSVADFRKEIENWLDDIPVIAYRETIPQRSARWLRRNPGIFASFVSAILIGAISVSIGYGLLERKNRTLFEQNVALEKSRQVASERREQAERALYDSLLSQAQLLVRQANASGWSWEAIDKIGQALPIAPPDADKTKLRTLWAASENAFDFRQVAELAEGIDCAALAFSPDGHLLAIGQRKHIMASNVYIYEVGSWKLLKTVSVSPSSGGIEGLKGVFARMSAGGTHQEGVTSLAFSPDAQTLIAGTRFGRLYAWQVSDVSDVNSMVELFQAGSVDRLQFLTNSRVVAAGGNRDGYQAKLWTKGESGWQIEDVPFTGQIRDLQVCGNNLLAVISDETLSWYDSRTLTPISHDYLPTERSRALASSRSGRLLAIEQRDDNSIKLFDIESGGSYQMPSKQSSFARSLSFSDGNDHLSVTAAASQITVFNLFAGHDDYRMIPVPGRDQPLAAFGPSSPYLAVTAERGVEIYELRRNRAMLQQPSFAGCEQVDDVCFDSSGDVHVAARASTPLFPTCRIYDLDAATMEPTKIHFLPYQTAQGIATNSSQAQYPPAEFTFAGDQLLCHVPYACLLGAIKQTTFGKESTSSPTRLWQAIALCSPGCLRDFESPLDQWFAPNSPASDYQRLIVRDPQIELPALPPLTPLVFSQSGLRAYGIAAGGSEVEVLRVSALDEADSASQTSSVALQHISRWSSNIESKLTGAAEPLCLQAVKEYAVLGSRDGIARKIDVGGTLVAREELTTANLTCLDAYKDLAIYGAFDGQMMLTSSDDLKLLLRWNAHKSPVTAVVLDGIKKIVATGSRSGEVILWRFDHQKIEQIVQLPTYRKPIKRLRLDAKADLLSIVYEDSVKVQVWSLAEFERQFTVFAISSGAGDVQQPDQPSVSN